VVDRFTARLLGRHVRERPEYGADVGEDGEGGGVGVVRGRERRPLPGEAEVEDLGVAVFGEEDVLGLEVAMDDPLVVSGGEAVGDLAGDLEGAPERKCALLQWDPERLAFEQLRDGVADAALLADVVESEDVGVR
jgi:hypothetical protein